MQCAYTDACRRYTLYGNKAADVLGGILAHVVQWQQQCMHNIFDFDS